MESKVVVIYADREPLEGIANPGPHQIYKNPRVTVEKRILTELRPDELRVEMIYAGLCGTDVHLVESNPDTGYIRSSAPAVIDISHALGRKDIVKPIAHAALSAGADGLMFESHYNPSIALSDSEQQLDLFETEELIDYLKSSFKFS